MLGIDVRGASPAPTGNWAGIYQKVCGRLRKTAGATPRQRQGHGGKPSRLFSTFEGREPGSFLRRIAHTAHHRAELGMLLDFLGRPNYSVYGPSIDSGCLAENGAKTIYPYPDIESLIEGE